MPHVVPRHHARLVCKEIPPCLFYPPGLAATGLFQSIPCGLLLWDKARSSWFGSLAGFGQGPSALIRLSHVTFVT